MKNKGKKIFILGLLVVTMGMMLVGCGKKKTVTLTVGGIGDVELAGIPEGTLNGSTSGDALTVSLKKEGDYDFVLRGEDGKEYTVTIKYHDGAVEGVTDDGLELGVAVK